MSGPLLRRLYLFSDTYGRSKNPFLQDDADALISTDFRSFPLEEVKRQFDIYGREAITRHVVSLVFDLHEEITNAKYISKETKEEFLKTYTGIFINAAPRVSKQNGSPFYVATSGNIRVVTTNPEGLSMVKKKIESLAHLSNEQNDVYGPTEQFRSSYTAYLLHPDHQLPLIEDSLDLIPDSPKGLWELSYVDRFGNLLTYASDPEAQWADAQKIAKEKGEPLRILIGNVSQPVYLGVSLKDAEPGSLVMYPNGNLEILRKWEATEDSYTRLYKSAFFQFGKPQLGAKVQVVM